MNWVVNYYLKNSFFENSKSLYLFDINYEVNKLWDECASKEKFFFYTKSILFARVASNFKATQKKS